MLAQFVSITLTCQLCLPSLFSLSFHILQVFQTAALIQNQLTNTVSHGIFFCYMYCLHCFADFLPELVPVADNALFVGDFNIHNMIIKVTLQLAFIDIVNSTGVRQHVLGATHCHNHA